MPTTEDRISGNGLPIATHTLYGGKPMNRKHSAVVGAVAAVAVAASLFSVVSTAPATAVSAQFCQENCNNSGYKYYFKRQIPAPPERGSEPRRIFIDCEGPDEARTDSLDIDFIGALSAVVFGQGITIDIHTDANDRPIGLEFIQTGDGALDELASQFGGVPLVCLDDRQPVHVK